MAPSPSSLRATSSWPSGLRPRSRRSTASPTRILGPTSRRRSPVSCHAACSSSAAARPAASWPRSSCASASRRRSCSPAPAWSPLLFTRAARVRALRPGARWGGGPDRGPCHARRAGAGTDGAHVIDLDDGTSAEGHAILLAVGREFPVRDLGMEAYGIEVVRARRLQARRAVADRRWAVGRRRPGGPRAPHAPGPLPGRARGPDGAGRIDRPGLPRPPRATYMDPESASVGVTLDQAIEAGLEPSSASPTSRRARRATPSRPRPAT
jgi:hypothetical protein